MYYPLFLDLRKRHCLVIGGGSVGTRKTSGLIRHGAFVTVISKEFSNKLIEMGKSGNPLLVSKNYEHSDLEGMFLIFAATDDKNLNSLIGKDSKDQGKLFSIADDPEKSCFITPSSINRGDLTFAVSTGGKSPALARKIRQELESSYGEEYAVFLRIMGDVRKVILDSGHDPDIHREQFRKILDCDIPSLIRDQGAVEIKNIFEDIFKIKLNEEIFTNLKAEQ